MVADLIAVVFVVVVVVLAVAVILQSSELFTKFPEKRIRWHRHGGHFHYATGK